MYSQWHLQDLCMMGIASGIISLVLTRSHLTKGLRHWLLDVRFLMIGELANCPFCMAFWTSLLFTLKIDSEGLHFWPISWLVITGLACLFMGVLLKLWLFHESELEDMRELLREARDTMKARWEGE